MTGYRLGLVEGDGIGREIVPLTRRVVDEALAQVGGTPVDWVTAPMGHAAIEACGEPLPESTLGTLADTDGWILGPHDSASYAAEHRAGPPPGGVIHGSVYTRTCDRPARIRGCRHSCRDSIS